MGYFTGYPKHVFLILVNEFCERFSFYGMKGILVLYMTRGLSYSSGTAVAIYHAFTAVCYFTPLLGAIIADGWLGKYRTILYVSMIYALGNAAMAITAIPFGGEFLSWGLFIGLVLIAFGSGGIKPCVSAFGGDQFKPDQVRQKESFFTIFYMFINIGSLLTTIVSPYIRSNVFCFDNNCYSLAFGIPAILMVCAIVAFIIGTPWYTKVPPGESILARIMGCVWTALKGKMKSKKHEKKDHWLDYAETKYDKQLISDIRDVFAVLWLFLPLPFFWALYDQQGSRWTLQAEQMNGDFDGFDWQPDQMSIINAGMIVILAPLLESVVYPLLTKIGIPHRPLQRMTWGMIFAAAAFVVAGVLQLFIDDSFPLKPGAGMSKVSFINSGPCDAHVYPFDTHLEQFDLKKDELRWFMVNSDNAGYNMTWNGVADCNSSNKTFTFAFEQEKAYEVMIYGVMDRTIAAELDNQAQLSVTLNSKSTFKFFNNLDYAVSLKAVPTKRQEPDQFINEILPKTFSESRQFAFATFDVFYTVDNTTVITDPTYIKISQQLVSTNGPLYIVLITPSEKENVTLVPKEEIGPTTLNIFLQIPQYTLLTIGECLFSITGLGFAYTQAPTSMKSLLTAAWLLTVAFGNIIIIIIDAIVSGEGNEAFLFFLFAGLLAVITVIFAIMSIFYKYVTPPEDEDDDNKSKKSFSSSSSSSSGSSVSGEEKKELGEVSIQGYDNKALPPADYDDDEKF